MMTELGKKTYELVKSYNLNKFYDIYSGHILINREDLTADVLVAAHKFLGDNTDWCLGYEEDFLYISPIEDLV